MRQEIRRRQLCLLLITGLLFSGMCVRFVCADSTFSREISLSLAENCRVIRDIYTGTLFGAEGENLQGFTARGISGTNHEAVYWLPIQKILSDYLILRQETSKEVPLYLRRRADSVIGYIHRQDGKKD